MTLKGAPILMVSSATAGSAISVPEAITRLAVTADLITFLLVLFMCSFPFGLCEAKRAIRPNDNSTSPMTPLGRKIMIRMKITPRTIWLPP